VRPEKDEGTIFISPQVVYPLGKAMLQIAVRAKHSSAVSPLISSIILTGITVALGFGLWALSASMSNVTGRQVASDMDERVAMIRSSMIVEYAAKVGGNVFICLYNNLDVPLVVVDVLFMRSDWTALNEPNPAPIITLQPRSLTTSCITRPIPAGASGKVILRVLAVPAHLFDPSDPFSKLNIAVEARREIVL